MKEFTQDITSSVTEIQLKGWCTHKVVVLFEGNMTMPKNWNLELF